MKKYRIVWLLEITNISGIVALSGKHKFALHSTFDANQNEVLNFTMMLISLTPF